MIEVKTGTRKFDDEFARSRKRFDLIFRLTMVLTTVVFVIAIIYLGYVLVKGADVVMNSDPNGIARTAGEMVKSFNEGAGK